MAQGRRVGHDRRSRSLQSKGDKEMAKFTGLRPKNGGIEIRAQVNGKRKSWFLSKPWNPTNCREASRLRSAYLSEIAQGSDHLRGDNPPFIEVAQDYLDYIRKMGLSAKHCSNVKNDINRRWGLYLGGMGIKDIRVRHCRDADTNISWTSAKRQQNCRSVLRQIFDFAIQDELIDDNPAKKLKEVSHQRATIDPFNEKERDAILREIETGARGYFIVAFETGMRTAELLGLDWSAIRGGKAHLNQTLVGGKLMQMKTKTERTVLLSPAAMDALSLDIRPTSGMVFTESHAYYCNAWRAALKAAGVRYRRPYTTRHTRACIGLQRGQTPAWIAKQLGHDLRTFFERYATWMDGQQDEAEMAKWGASTKTGTEWGQKNNDSN